MRANDSKLRRFNSTAKWKRNPKGEIWDGTTKKQKKSDEVEI